MITADEMLRRLNAAVEDLDDAERRFAGARAAGRKLAARKSLPIAVADVGTDGTREMKAAKQDWATAHTRIQSYSAALSALLLHENARSVRQLRAERRVA